jgi:hypothetical protein
MKTFSSSLALTAVLLLSGCVPEPERVTAPSVPPILPSFVTAELDLLFFDTLAPPAEGASDTWFAAVEQIRWADSLLARRFSAPAAILRAAAQTTPQKQDDHWRWDYRVTHDGVEYDGWIGGGHSGIQIGWMITASAPARVPPMADHVWLIGGADWYSYAGTWEIVEPSGPPNLQWIQYYNDGNEPRIRYNMEGNGILDFRRRGSVRDLQVTSSVSGAQRRILWNTATGQGSVLVWPSGETRCWDRQQLDTMECFAVGP